MDTLVLSRRGLLAGLGVAGAGVLFGFTLPAKGQMFVADGPPRPLLNAWIRIEADGKVAILCNTSELGQGTSTGIPMLVAEELEVAWEDVRVEPAPIAKAYANPRIDQIGTYGSMGIYPQFDMLRKVGAAARIMLVQAAAQQWGVDPADCKANNGKVWHKPSGRDVGYGVLAAIAATLPVPNDPPLKPREAWRLIGKPLPRLDIPAKVDGSAQYGIDVRVPGMMVATLAQCPWPRGRLVSVDSAPAMAVRGVVRVVTLDNAVAVVADGWWPAKKGLDALSPVWDPGDDPRLSDEAAAAKLRKAAEAGTGMPFAPRDRDPAKLEADWTAAMKGASKKISAGYSVPFLDHAALEPMNGTAAVGPDAAELWLPTQTPELTRRHVAEALGLPPEKVTVNTTLSGGGFGRRIETDFAVQAALVARATGRPVKLIWSREEDMRHGYYRPAAAAHLRAGLDADGRPVAFRLDVAAPSPALHAASARETYSKPDAPPDFLALLYAARLPYALGAIHLTYARTELGPRCGFWRGVAASHNAFFIECFIDELAQEANTDPVALRRGLLGSQTRELGVLEAAADALQWATPVGRGRHRGIAMARLNYSVTAAAVELSHEEGGIVRLHKLAAVLDCGIAVNPDSVRAQIEGSVIWGLTQAIHGRITLKDGEVEQGNYHDYPLLTLVETPDFQVILRETGDRPTASGQEVVPPVAPALVNALSRASGRRIRSLPLVAQGFRFG